MVILLSLVYLTNIYSQESSTVIGLSFGSLHTSDAVIFNDPDLSKKPDLVFTKIGVGVKFSNNVVFSVDVVIDRWYIETSVFIPMYSLRHRKYACNKTIFK